MGNKYIIELEDKPFHNEDGDSLCRVKGFNSLVFDMTGISKLAHYHEPDLEQVKKEAYQKGYETGYEDGYNEPGKNQQEAYQRGLSDAWEAARKISVIPYNEVKKIFGAAGWHIFMKCAVSEVIEKIKAWDEKKQEEIKVGDEVAFHHDDGRPDTVVVVTYIGQDGFIDGMDGRGTQYAHKNPKRWTKTGRYFPELVSILEKMRGEQDG